MMNYKKYTRQYFMPPERCMDWADKEYAGSCSGMVQR